MKEESKNQGTESNHSFFFQLKVTFVCTYHSLTLVTFHRRHFKPTHISFLYSSLSIKVFLLPTLIDFCPNSSCSSLFCLKERRDRLTNFLAFILLLIHHSSHFLPISFLHFPLHFPNVVLQRRKIEEVSKSKVAE